MPATQVVEIPILSPEGRERDPLAELQRLRDRVSVEEFAAIAATFAQLTLELSRKGARGRVKPTHVDYITTDVFSGETPVFLKLLSADREIETAPVDFVKEVLTVIDLRNHMDLFSGTYIYSLTVTQPTKPHDVLGPELWASLPLVHQAQVRVGYLPHELLYSLPPPELENLLTGIAQRSAAFEASVKPSATAVNVRKTVKLAQAAPTHAPTVSSSDA